MIYVAQSPLSLLKQSYDIGRYMCEYTSTYTYLHIVQNYVCVLKCFIVKGYFEEKKKEDSQC